jgi:hypothetical protein
MSKRSTNLAAKLLGAALWLAFVALPILSWRILKAAFRTARLVGRSRQLLASTIRCPNGHENPASGFWTCSCGATFSGWAWAPCPVCGKSADFVDGCEVCGASLISPLR